jgi:large subunit ribosomal protein L30e
MINLKSEIEKGNVILGSKEALKAIKSGGLRMVIVSKNCPEDTREKINHYCKISNIEIEEDEKTGKELGISCGKPFGVAVIGIKN